MNGEVVLPNIFQNGFSFTSKATPAMKLEPKPFLEEPEPSQTGPSLKLLVRFFSLNFLVKKTFH